MTIKLYEQLKKNLEKYHPPRDPQLKTVKWLADNWEEYRIFCLNAPVGTGKSDIAVAVQDLFPNTVIITPNNNLVDQYGDSFDFLNLLKGKDNYSCFADSDCGTCYKNMKKYCKGCPYLAARTRAEIGDPTIANPMSYFYNVRKDNISPATVLVVDEAHTLASFIRSIFTTKLSFEDVRWNKADLKDLASLTAFLRKQEDKVAKLAELKRKNKEDAEKEDALVTRISKVAWAIGEDPSVWFFYESDDYHKGKVLNIECLYPPKYVLDVFMKSNKIILMSGTLFPNHIKELVGDTPYTYLSLPSIIPKENRKVLCWPAAQQVNASTPPEVFAAKIKQIIGANPGKQGIIHATYKMGEQLLELLKHLNVQGNNKTNKNEVLERFKRKEFQWLMACGMSEGVDLPGDLGEVNVICKMQFPYLKDAFVEKRMKLPDGQLWYSAAALLHLVQATGRTNRGPTDKSVTYILDPNANRCMDTIERLAGKDTDKYIPPYFKEAFFNV